MTGAEPLSGFKTPYLNSSRWSEFQGTDWSGYESETEGSDPNRGWDSVYPNWTLGDDAPISVREIKRIIEQLGETIGFQRDNVRNIFDYLMKLLDSRASRASPELALKSIHGDYIGGVNANYRKWYLASGMDLEDGESLPGHTAPRRAWENPEERWFRGFKTLTPRDYVTQVGLYLLCWGEANNVRFMPECLCFIFKCCNDYYYSIQGAWDYEKPQINFLDHVITPIYSAIKHQRYYSDSNGMLCSVDKDHAEVVGYDDINELFWYKEGLRKIKLKSKMTIMDLPRHQRYLALREVDWEKSVFKTFREVRSWLHVLLNFSRVINIHLAIYWCYITINSYPMYTQNYRVARDNRPPVAIKASVVSLFGGIVCFTNIAAVLIEAMAVPRRWSGARPILRRLLCLSFLLGLTTSPTALIFLSERVRSNKPIALSVSVFQILSTVLTTVYLIFAIPSSLFGTMLNIERCLAAREFTANFYKLRGTDKVASYALWTGVFACKSLESYFFLTRSMSDSIRELTVMRSICGGDSILGSRLCRIQPLLILGMILVLGLILFFLDTYLWYVIWNTLFSVLRSFYIGASIWTPWRNIFSRLPKRIYSKLIITSKNHKAAHKVQVSKIWNSIVISMYREHFLSIEQVQKLIYQQQLDNENEIDLREPTFFISQEDESLKSDLFYSNSEAQRRITFFAQSLSTPVPDIQEIRNMPAFSVFIPHYGEKIILSLREIIREDGNLSQLTMLEYLKQLYPSEWHNFVSDSILMAEELESSNEEDDSHSEDLLKIPFQSVGFKIAKPEYVMRTRIWASLRSQTLYRTVSGFMNYSRAIKILQDIETSKSMDDDVYDDRKLRSIHCMALRKFRMILSMQRYQQFSDEERENTEYLLRAYPELQIAYVEEEYDLKSRSSSFYSCLIDGSCTIMSGGDRKPKYRIKLSGNPILGDGKSDNQNHAVVFTRGEYIQLVDANQDNYLEECLKVRNILAEFDEMSLIDPYDGSHELKLPNNPVAIIGTREYIFSENIGILGDIAAGKEQTFGTLYARTLAQVGGKLHYGHPDFLNSIFMNTRGGVSKAQKGLHLNEDIYAGMTALMRGGRIKHSEYMQCGKGRDLGFISILNFITKIGGGMGEQMISREYYYLGTQLPLDRFLSFYYAHAGFHLNNVFIILSIQLFLMVGINLAALASESVICKYNKNVPFTDPREPLRCSNLIPVIKWLERCVFSIFVVFLISFVPLGVQELTEKGVFKALERLTKHILSLSSLFEIFVCKVYAHSLIRDLSVGGALYIPTGRGFATKRESFNDLFFRFGYVSLRSGTFSILLMSYISIHLWSPSFIYLWMTILGLVVSPFLYNPNQLQVDKFFMDYLEFLRWMFFESIGDSKSWISTTRRERIQFTGTKRITTHSIDNIKMKDKVRPSRLNLLVTTVLMKLCTATAITTAYLFANTHNELNSRQKSRAFGRILLITLLPLCAHLVVLSGLFVISAITGPVLTFGFKRYGISIAFVAHLLSLVTYLLVLEILWYLQNFNFGQTVLAIALMALIKSFLILVVTLCLSREFSNEEANNAWWSGTWATAGFKWRILTQPWREGTCKFIEMQQFAADFFVGHTIFYLQLPLLIIPLANTWHSMMLFWLKPGDMLKKRILSRKKYRRQAIKLFFSTLFFVGGLLTVLALIIVPKVLIQRKIVNVSYYMPPLIEALKQPAQRRIRRTGMHNDLIVKNLT